LYYVALYRQKHAQFALQIYLDALRLVDVISGKSHLFLHLALISNGRTGALLVTVMAFFTAT